jgi:predicted Rossmann fold nucleotide-binding protein DprA/Smf involved in DNA uptake
MCTYLGNKELLSRWKIGVLASRKIATSAILPTLDWAVEMSKQTDVAVVSGFHSRLEKDVLRFLLQGKCGIIVILARGMYRKLPQIYDAAMNENRLLIISLEKETVTRVSERTAHKRNKYVEDLADELRQIYSL